MNLPIMDLDTPSNAQVILDNLRESERFDLYPKEKNIENPIFGQLREEYKLTQKSHENLLRIQEYHQFLNETKKDLLSLGLYTSIVSPVLENMMATSREIDVACNSINHFVEDQGVDSLLEQFKYENVYLADLANSVNTTYSKIAEESSCKIKEGLPECEIYKIEDKDIKDYILDCKSKIPRDITNMITKRVEDSVNDFIDDKKKSQFQIQKIYQKAKEKVEEYNQAQQSFDSMQQTDVPIDGNSMDPEVAVDNNLNAKLDSQQNEELMNSQNPSMQAPPSALGGNAPNTPTQEALAWAKSQESMILESSYSVFDAMVRVIMESTHTHKVLKEEYSDETGKTSLKKVVSDVKAMYTVLEAFNVLNIIKLDSDYLQNMIQEMHNGIENKH